MHAIRQITVAAHLLSCIALVAAVGPATAQGCENEAIRSTQHATFLPECRAYELVSPGSNPYLQKTGTAEGARASIAGNAIAYYSYYPAEGVTTSGFFYLATRYANGWSTRVVAPQDSPGGAEETACRQSVYFSAELTASVLSDGWNSEEETLGASYCQSSEEELAANAPAGFGNLYLRGSLTEPYQLINLTPAKEAPSNARLEDANDDLSRVLFGEDAKLTPEAPSGYNLYEWAGGEVHLVSFLPNGTAVAGKLADGGSHTANPGTYEGFPYGLAPETHAMAPDGERVFFYAENEGHMNLYLRVNATQPSGTLEGANCLAQKALACTIQLDSKQVGASGESGEGVFWYATENDQRVFFADEKRLTSGSGSMSKKPDLYEYDLESDKLTDVTPEALANAPANARGLVGASDDGTYLYFVATGDLTGPQVNSSQHSAAKSGEPNLYLYHAGALTFIGTLQPQDSTDWQEKPALNQTNDGELTARVSPSGEYLAFGSFSELTNFSNVDAKTGDPDKELFVYDAADNQLACASCASGTKPLGNTEMPFPTAFSSEKPHGSPVYLSRDVLNDGRVFFTSPNKLVAQDSNGVADVYEYAEGKVYLISSGQDPAGSTFYDASPNGDNVFFVTAQGLLPRDTDNNDSIYDARVNGGFAEPEAVTLCETDASCHPYGSDTFGLIAPLTDTFKGTGNITSKNSGKGSSHKKCLKGTVKHRGKCIKSSRRTRRGKKRKRS